MSPVVPRLRRFGPGRRALHHSPWRLLAGALTLVALLGATSATAQRMQFRHLGIDDGLPSSLVSDVLQDRRGFMWIGTAHGVSRYDGHRFQTYAPMRDSAHTLPVGLVDHLYEDRAGVLWVVTTAGLSRYDGSIDGFITYSAAAITRHRRESSVRTVTGAAGATDALPGDPEVTSVLQDHLGRLLVGTTVGLYVLDRESGKAQVLTLGATGTEGERRSVTTIFEDRGQRLWIGTRDGLYALGTGSRAPRYWSADPRAADSLPGARVRTIAEDASGRIWIGTDGGGIARIDPRSKRLARLQHIADDPRSLSGNRVIRLFADRTRGGMWVGMENAGIDYFDPQTESFTHHRYDANDPMSIRSNSIWALYQDASGLLWVGTFSGGLDVSMRNSEAIQLFQSVGGDQASLSYDAVPGFGEDRNHNIWVTTDGGGINRFDPLTARFERFTTRNSNLPVDAVLSMAQDRDGALWFATWGGGLARFDEQQRRFTPFTTANSDLPNDNVYEVLVNRAGEVWVGTDEGVVATLDRASRKFTRQSSVVAAGSAPSSVLILRELADGSLAAGLRTGGLAILNPRTGAQRHFMASADSTTGIASNSVRALYESSPGVLWVGTENGLDRLDLNTGRRTHMGTANGLPSIYIDGIVADAAGRLWISTDHGLSRYDLVSGTIRTFTRLDGLQSNEFLMRSAFRASDGTLYFGGNHGFSVIRPERLVENLRAPPVVFTNLLLFNKPVTPSTGATPLRRVLYETSELTLSHTQNVMTFEFSALDFSAPEKTRYAYQLIGFDSDWQYVGEQHTASYTNLTPGHYQLRVKASNGDGVWNDQGAALALVITPPIWRTWWFQLSCALVALLGLIQLWRFQARRRLEIALSRQALHDPLTGLANRVLFRDRVENALARLQREQVGVTRGAANAIDDPRVAVLFLDLDNFKTVNDSLGHHAGDQLLRVVSSRLLNATRGSDTVARFGGDEFAVLLENMRSADDAYVVADRITSSLRTAVSVGDDAHPREARVGVSIGIAFAHVASESTELLRNADAAMYRAKDAGKGRYVVFDPELVAAAEEELDLQQGIALAMARGEMALVFQPIVQLDTGTVVSVEALLRWTHPTRGAISPSRFIPLAESSGVILELGHWALDAACRAAASWPTRADGHDIGISVNVSGRQLLHSFLLTEVEAALTANRLPASRLTLEITESVLMKDSNAALRVLHALKSLGIRLAVDDFGTGYSSLRYLQQFPIDVLKVDKSFVDNVDGGVQDASLARMIIGLGESLGLAMVAEGIEHQVQRERLLAMGCEFGQGYLFAKPLAESAIRELLTSGRPLCPEPDATTCTRTGSMDLIAPI